MITYYFPPVIYGSGIRVLNFAKYLTQYGWNSTVLTLNHSTFNVLKDFSLSERVKESGIKVYAVNLIKVFSKIASANYPNVKREISAEILSYLYKIASLNEPEEIWKSRATKLGEKILKSEKYNAIIAFVPPLSTAQVGAYLAKKFKIPLIIDYSFIQNQKNHHQKQKKNFYAQAIRSSLITEKSKIISFKTISSLIITLLKLSQLDLSHLNFKIMSQALMINSHLHFHRVKLAVKNSNLF